MKPRIGFDRVQFLPPGNEFSIVPGEVVIPAQPDWFIVYRKASDGAPQPVERAPIIGWLISKEAATPGTASTYATPIAVHPGDWLGSTGNKEGLEADGWEWETANLPGGRRHEWEVAFATKPIPQPEPRPVSSW